MYFLIVICNIGIAVSDADVEQYRDDGRCGLFYRLSNEEQAPCEHNLTDGRERTCCSSEGWCGADSWEYCDCDGCIDYTPAEYSKALSWTPLQVGNWTDFIDANVSASIKIEWKFERLKTPLQDLEFTVETYLYTTTSNLSSGYFNMYYRMAGTATTSSILKLYSEVEGSCRDTSAFSVLPANISWDPLSDNFATIDTSTTADFGDCYADWKKEIVTPGTISRIQLQLVDDGDNLDEYVDVSYRVLIPAITCDKPNGTHAVVISPKDSITINNGSYYIVHCADGYRTSQYEYYDYMQCLESGKLDDLKYCYPFYCSKPDIDNAIITPVNNTIQEGEKYTIDCEYGYTESTESAIVQCSKHGYHPYRITCDTNKCDRPNITNGRVYGEEDDYVTYVGSFYTVICDDCYSIGGNKGVERSRVECLGNGSLSTTLTCDMTRCNKPNITNGVLSPEISTIDCGSYYTIKCDDGYAPPSSEYIGCDNRNTEAISVATYNECVNSNCKLEPLLWVVSSIAAALTLTIL